MLCYTDSDGTFDKGVLVTDAFSQKYDHPAVKELLELFPSEDAREWVRRWVEVKEETQRIVDTGTLWSENQDLVKYNIASRLGESMVEDSLEYSMTKNSISCKAAVLKRKI